MSYQATWLPGVGYLELADPRRVGAVFLHQFDFVLDLMAASMAADFS